MDKKIIAAIKSIDGISYGVGVISGAILGFLFVFYIVTPGSMTMVSNNEMEMDIAASGTPGSVVTQTKTVTINPYNMGKITSEKQFLYNMKAHHEAAVLMAQQVLAIPSIHPEIKTLAKNIIDTQTTEIRSMRDYIASWKY